MPAPSTRNWTANELSDFAGGHYHVEVTGEVQTSATNYMPKLSYRNPQGINPRILMLDLTIEKTAEFGGQIVMFRKAHYSRPTTGDEYDEADILFEGQVIERITVGHPKTVVAKPAPKPAGKKKAKKKSKAKPAKKVQAKKKPAKKAKKKKAAKKKKRL